MRIPPVIGVCSAAWTFRNRRADNGLVINHEIDIEFPGRAHIDAPPSLDYVALTTWTGLGSDEHSTAFARVDDATGRFRTYRMDWILPKPDDPEAGKRAGRVDFFVDGELLHSTNRNIPSEPAPFLVGVWFPKAWAGSPDFVEASLLVDWVRITQPYD